jgi:hypothetical protein
MLGRCRLHLRVCNICAPSDLIFLAAKMTWQMRLVLQSMAKNLRPRKPLTIFLRYLHFAYLLLVAVISASLGAVCIVLAVYSSQNSGLSNAREGSAFTFSWRFLPTIISVLYALLWTPIMKDVLRTEAWALLSMPGGSKASASLLKAEQWWWKEAFNAIRNKGKAGGIRWPVFLAVVGTMIGSVVINPLSAGFLDVDDATSVQQKQFYTFKSPPSPLSTPEINDSTYLRAIANLVFNITTSAWMKDDYTVMPFWPETATNMPNGARLSTIPQDWSGNTSVFKVEFDCEPFTNISFIRNPKVPLPTFTTPLIRFGSPSGCSLNHATLYNGGGAWSQFNVSVSTSL